MKNKILDNLPTLFIMLLFIFGMTLVYNHAKAEEDFQKYNLYLMQYPMMCGTPQDVDRYIVDRLLDNIGRQRRSMLTSDNIDVFSYG